MPKAPPTVPMYTNGMYGFVPKYKRCKPITPNGRGKARVAAIIFLPVLLFFLRVNHNGFGRSILLSIVSISHVFFAEWEANDLPAQIIKSMRIIFFNRLGYE